MNLHLELWRFHSVCNIYLYYVSLFRPGTSEWLRAAACAICESSHTAQAQWNERTKIAYIHGIRLLPRSNAFLNDFAVYILYEFHCHQFFFRCGRRRPSLFSSALFQFICERCGGIFALLCSLHILCHFMRTNNANDWNNKMRIITSRVHIFFVHFVWQKEWETFSRTLNDPIPTAIDR